MILHIDPLLVPGFVRTSNFKPAFINNRAYFADTESEQAGFDNYWNPKPASMQDGNGCQGVLVAMVGMLILLAIVIALASCAPPPQARFKQNPNITPYEYQLNSKRNIKRKYRKAFAPKKSLRPSLK